MAWDDTKGGGDNKVTATEWNNMVIDQKTRIVNIVTDTTPQLGGNLDANGKTVGDATEADLTKLNSLTATATELNYVDGVTSAIQDQIDAITTTTFTLTVGTSGSGADYITDGTADQIQIQQAIDAAETAGGGNVLILGGAYSISSAIHMKSDVHVTGVGYGTVITLASGSNTEAFQTQDEDRWSVKKMKLDMNGAGQTSAGWGFWSKACDYAVVEDVWVFEPRTGAGVWTCYDPDEDPGSRGDPSRHCMFVRCRGDTKVGTGFTTDMWATQKAHNCGFINCIATGAAESLDNGFGMYGISGEEDIASQGLFAIGCEAYGNQNGFNLEFTDSGLISGCVAHDNLRSGFNCSDSTHGTITGCVSYDNEYGMTVDADTERTVITGNTISSNDNHGVYCSGSYITFTDNIISDNALHGLYFENTNNCIINDNNIVDNDTGGAGTTFYAAIQTEHCGNIIIKGNNIHNTGANGMYQGIYHTGGSSDKFVISNNIVDNMDSAGIHVKTSAYGIITNNVVTNNATDGIEFEDCTYSICANNILTSNAAYGVDYNSGTNTGLDVRDNIYVSNVSGSTNP